MIQRVQAARRSDSGFTLIELLIVVVILGVLSGIVVFAVTAFNGDGVAAACKADKKNVEIAEEAYYAKTGGTAANIAALTGAGYLKEAPPDGTKPGDKYSVTLANGVITSSC